MLVLENKNKEDISLKRLIFNFILQMTVCLLVPIKNSVIGKVSFLIFNADKRFVLLIYN